MDYSYALLFPDKLFSWYAVFYTCIPTREVPELFSQSVSRTLMAAFKCNEFNISYMD